ncbi:hypothetical protein OPKNFCMD_2709 [Methylobacterium crusticola]|uniref:Sulfotransferase family protein n=1 Tax=Methylobacterium crusticola TaxID=1697972 RepID=A0ABQ4QX82_9HYPH|nr:hypothetical protein [Methylobacterium crusticola]GJD49973.1 hypothetical protein OPKNFCMD_2709 [Methylobacterium crusticola]
MQVFIKSIPRSGHHFLSTMLYQYFGDDIRYCFQAGPEACCGRTPCVAAGPRPLFMQKSHDPRLTDPRDVLSVRYLIQIREPAGQIASEIERARARRGDAFPIAERDFAEWWLAHQARYYRAFRARWTAPPPEGALVLDYGALRDDPEAALARAIRLFGRAPDGARVAQVVARNRTRLARNPRLDHETLPFRPRAAASTGGLPPDLFADYLDLVAASGRATRLTRIEAVLGLLAAGPPGPAGGPPGLAATPPGPAATPDETLSAAAAAAAGLGNARLAGQVRKALAAAGREAEALALKRALAKPP